MRLVDADKQLEWVDCMTPIHGIGLEPVVAVETVQNLIKGTPTIDAIPVEWLNQKYAENEPREDKDYDYFLWDAIAYILTEWHNEQEAR